MLALADEGAKQDLINKLKGIGLSDDQSSKVAELIEKEPIDFQASELQYVDEPAAWQVTVEGVRHEIKPAVSGLSLDIPLPKIPINVNPSIDIRNLTLGSIGLNSDTTLSASNIATTGSKIDDFSILTDVPDVVSYDKAELENARIKPIEVPTFGLPELATTIEIPKLGSTQIPLTIESTTGSSDLSLTILDWHPRWRKEICIKIFGWKKCAWIEFGINLTITLVYKWIIDLLRITINIKDAFLNKIAVSIKLSRIAINKIKIGLLSLKRIVVKAVV